MLLPQLIICSLAVLGPSLLSAAIVPNATVPNATVPSSSKLVNHTVNMECGRSLTMGVDYYPEQWPLEDMMDDLKAMKEDLGVDFIRIGEFMWHTLEPKDGAFDFSFLDKVINAAVSFGLKVMLGTPTATVPAWLYTAHDDIFARGPDSAEGYTASTSTFGGRQQRSLNSETYLKYARRIVARMAERYARNPEVIYWQIDNEFGNEEGDLDFSVHAQAAWRVWLVEHFHDDINLLNSAWGTVFWSVTYDSFSQIPVPSYTRPGGKKQGEEQFRSNQSPGMLLDYRRFLADAMTKFTNMQVDILRENDVVGCLTTNSNNNFWRRSINHNDIFARLDFPAFDNYPVWGGSLAPASPASLAMAFDAVRGWTTEKNRKAGWMVAEQLIGAQGHDIIGYTPRPDQIVAWSAQTLLHGATSLAFFRYRAATFGQEEYCYGILDQTTPRGTGRKWREAKKFFSLARKHEDLWLGPIEAQVLLMYDTDAVFSWNAQPQSTAFSYHKEAARMYEPFWKSGAAVDVLSTQRVIGKYKTAAELLQAYKILVLPAPIIVPNELIDLIAEYVDRGGIVWSGFRSDLKDKNNSMNVVPSRLAALAGVEIEEIESLNKPLSAPVFTTKPPLIYANVTVWRDGLRIKPGSDVEKIWSYADRFFGGLGLAAVTRRKTKAGGEFVYMGAGMQSDELIPLAMHALEVKNVPHVGVSPSDNMERVLRKDVHGKFWRITINYADQAKSDGNGLTLQPYEVDIRRHTQSMAKKRKTDL